MITSLAKREPSEHTLALFKELFTASPDAILVSDSSGRISTVNPAANGFSAMARQNCSGAWLRFSSLNDFAAGIPSTAVPMQPRPAHVPWEQALDFTACGKTEPSFRLTSCSALFGRWRRTLCLDRGAGYHRAQAGGRRLFAVVKSDFVCWWTEPVIMRSSCSMRKVEWLAGIREREQSGGPRRRGTTCYISRLMATAVRLSFPDGCDLCPAWIEDQRPARRFVVALGQRDRSTSATTAWPIFGPPRSHATSRLAKVRKSPWYSNWAKQCGPTRTSGRCW